MGTELLSAVWIGAYLLGILDTLVLGRGLLLPAVVYSTFIAGIAALIGGPGLATIVLVVSSLWMRQHFQSEPKPPKQ